MKTPFLVATGALLLAVTVAEASGLSEEDKAALDKIIARAGKRDALNYISRAKQAAVQPTTNADDNGRAVSPTERPAAYRDELSALVRKNEKNPPASSNGKQIAAEKPISSPKQYSECAGFTFLLRRDWKDVGFLGCPQSVEKAIGAEIAFASDQANNNRIWSVNGTTALFFSSITDPDYWWNPTTKSVGAYATVNRTFNSATALSASDVDKLAYGLDLQLGYDASYGGHFFSLRGGGVEDHIKDTSSAAFTFEYQPVVAPLHLSDPIQYVFGLPYFFRFDPSLVVQYNQVTGSKQILNFNNRTEALRIGPQVVLRLNAYPGGPTILSRMNAMFSYHYAYETYSGAYLSWLTSAVGFNIDDAGHLAVALTYNRGNEEDTGKFTNIYRISLTGKI